MTAAALGARARPAAVAVVVALTVAVAATGAAHAQGSAAAGGEAAAPPVPAPAPEPTVGGRLPVFSAATSPDPLVRAAAMPALAALQTTRAHALLGFVAWADADARVRLAAVIAMGGTRNADLATVALSA